jgi:glycolate oxidase FAD binding subunit
MSTARAPASLTELVDAVRSAPRLLAVGAGTKPRLAAVDAVKLSLTRLRGMLEYEPSEFTFTALAGTPVQEIAEALGARGQYLPFDPLCAKAGATLGGTVASGLSGPGRFRFGGLRDFILGVRFVDGGGRLLRMGGKVVKNAAGFDLPKFFVGSLGRFGVLAEMTFKVFPRPAATLTLRLPAATMVEAARILEEAARTRWEADALEVLPAGGGVCVRLAGPETALREISREILARWPGEILGAADAASLWSALGEFTWAYDDGALLKVVVTLEVLPALDEKLRAIDGALAHVSAGGNAAYVSLPPGTAAGALAAELRGLGLRALGLRGDVPLWCGVEARPKIAQAVKDALDAEHRFPGLDD